MIKFYFFIAIFWMIISCQNRNQQQDSEVIDLDLSSNYKQVSSPYDFFESINLIKLETSNECLIKRINEIFIYDSLMFIQNAEEDILVFTDSGKFKYKISSIGRGPGEYISLDKMLIDTLKMYISIFDGTSRKLINYDFEGIFINEINNFCSGNVIRDMIKLPSGNILCFTPDYVDDGYLSGLWETDSLGNVLKIYFEANKNHIVSHQESDTYLFVADNNEYGVWTPDLNHLYYVYDRNISKTYRYNIKQKSTSNYPTRSVSDIPNDAYTLMTLFDKNSFIISHWFSPEKGYCMSLYDKRKNFTKNTRSFSLVDDYLLGRFVRFNNHKYLVEVIDSDMIVEFYSRREEFSENMKLFLSTVNANDNPVLQFIKVK